jgi:lipopolysaccharide transport system ATP-binding protein
MKAIRTRALAKDYLVGGARAYGYQTLRERISDVFARPNGAAEGRILHALRDVDLDIEDGEAVGFIGHNGAGKTTLLKVLSRVTTPTAGSAEVRGRVGSLLEVGTGFHPELTGRENIFLYGAILGMRRAEIRRRFADIVDFAGMERFLDTPVKRYSSGMFVRLAFSVAAHLNPEILIVDEVLAVGDAAFQRKCLDRMSQVAASGRTVLFVSHNMAVIQSLCSRAVLLERGRVVADDRVDAAVATYLGGLEQTARTDLLARTDRTGWRESMVRAAWVQPEGAGFLSTGCPATFGVECTTLLPGMVCQVQVFNQLGLAVLCFNSGTVSAADDCSAEAAEFRCELPALPLLAGGYRMDVTLWGGGHLQDALSGAAYFHVEQGVVDGRAAVRSGSADVVVPHRWTGPRP